mmetsp:Transcript_100689/g.260046  ORF Transcript_100689/g.260046 Transcript_100689/m.260046 type:complete len:289 (+) Transcript_100689:198-1064(+)
MKSELRVVTEHAKHDAAKLRNVARTSMLPQCLNDGLHTTQARTDCSTAHGVADAGKCCDATLLDVGILGVAHHGLNDHRDCACLHRQCLVGIAAVGDVAKGTNSHPLQLRLQGQVPHCKTEGCNAATTGDLGHRLIPGQVTRGQAAEETAGRALDLGLRRKHLHAGHHRVNKDHAAMPHAGVVEEDVCCTNQRLRCNFIGLVQMPTELAITDVEAAFALGAQLRLHDSLNIIRGGVRCTLTGLRGTSHRLQGLARSFAHSLIGAGTDGIQADHDAIVLNTASGSRWVL